MEQHVSEPSPRAQVMAFMEENWREPGFTCPNGDTYPWLWLWDSCFHSIIWASLGRDDRAIAELRSALSGQHGDGFVPHIVYFNGFDGHDSFWRARGTSSITQPPIYGHTIAALSRMGVDVPDELMERGRRGLEFLLKVRRRSPGGLVSMVHPWESGCDHSPRWDALFFPDGSIPSSDLWFRRKGELVAAVDLVDGSPVSSEACDIGSVAFNAMIAFCAAELAETIADSDLADLASELRGSLADRWDPELSSWVDEGVTEKTSARVRTLEALLPLLVDPPVDQQLAVISELADTGAFAGRYGLRQVHRQEGTYAPREYWRGASWAQLNYLIEVGLRRIGQSPRADLIASSATAGALKSGFSEYWDPDEGLGGGARPQSWSGLIVASRVAMTTSQETPRLS